MKKILSLVLALCVVLSLGSAFAWENVGIETTGTNYLCDERTTLTVCTYDGVSQAFHPIGNDLRFWQWLEEYTNVHIEWEVHSNADYGTVKSTKLAAGELDTDIMNVGSIDLAVNAGMNGMAAALDLANMPNIQAYNDSTLPIIITNNTAADGNIYSISGNVSPNMGHICIMYNTEWMEKVGKEAPTTLDEFYDLCKAFQEAGDLNGNGEADEIILTAPGIGTIVNILGNSFGLLQYEDCLAFSVDDEGKVYPEITTAEERECWQYCKKLYQEGIIDPGITSNSADIMSQKIANDQVGIFIYYSAFSCSYGYLCSRGQEWQAEHPNDQSLCIYYMGEALEGPRGDKFFSLRNRAGNDSCIVSAKSEHIELATKWLDVLTCDPVCLKVRTLGWEGEHYSMNEDGSYTLIYAEDGSCDMSALGCGQLAMPHYQDYNQLMASKMAIDWYVEQYNKILEDEWRAPVVPIIGAYTEEEQNLLDMGKSDCDSYFKETRANMITGDVEITDETWQNYIDTLDSLGMQNWIAAEQLIYDRTKG